VFKAELNEFLTRELSEDGYSGVEVRVTPTRTEIIIMATRTDRVLGEKNRRIRELTSVVQKRFNFPENSVVLYGEKVANRGLCAIAQAESLRFKLIGGLAVRRACYGVLRYIMECGAKGKKTKTFEHQKHVFFFVRMRSGRFWQTARSESQIHEIRRRFDDPFG
jgi:small subunit ribosomal protein S3e